jgi:hypothetical protein
LTEPIRVSGQNGLKSFFKTGSNGSPSYFHVFFLVAFLEETFIRNIIINFMTIICNNNNNNNNNNNAVINNNYERVQYLFCSPNFPLLSERISSKFVHYLGTHPHKRIHSPVLRNKYTERASAVKMSR